MIVQQSLQRDQRILETLYVSIPICWAGKKWFLADRVVANDIIARSFRFSLFAVWSIFCLTTAMQKQEGRSLAKSMEK
jgi:hypothetical protein